MPLPNFDDFRVVWVEKTKARHGHGGEGWEFGTCLWSPTTNKTGGRIYKNMVAARSGDLVLHFYEDSPFGKELDHCFCGVSIVDGSAEVKNDQPPSLANGRGGLSTTESAYVILHPLLNLWLSTNLLRNMKYK
jgi:hypothetical protein